MLDYAYNDEIFELLVAMFEVLVTISALFYTIEL